MDKKDLLHKLSGIIQNEITNILNERSYKYGGLLDPDNFDPIDPEVHIKGWGTLTRSSLRKEIVQRLIGLSKTARSAAAGGPGSFRKFQGILNDVTVSSTLHNMLQAEIEISNELEDRRSKGGRRATPIPKQY